MWTLKGLVKSTQEVQANINGKWVPARPLVCCLKHRMKDAWEVFRGRADAVKWPEGQ